MKNRVRRSSILAAVFVLVAMMLGIAPAQAAPGNILPPFDIGQTWYICQGYNGPVSHSGNSQYGLDLTGSPGCGNGASGRNVRAPMPGTVVGYQSAYGNLCINTTGGRSYTLTHINSNITSGNVSAGQLVGTVAAPGLRGNQNVSHIHFQLWNGSNCYSGAGIPFDAANGARICGAPDLTASGPAGTGNGTWSGTSFMGDNCTTAPAPQVHFDKPAVIEVSGGQVDTFIIASDGKLKFRYWNPSSNLSDWMDWGNPGVSLLGSPVPILKEDDELHVFARGTNSHLYERYWTPTDGFSPWIDWGGTGVASTPTAVVLPDGNIHVWVRGTDGRLWEQFNSSAGLSGWISWDKPSSTVLVYDPVVSIGTGGAVQVYAAGADHHLYERYRANDGGLSPWIDWGGTGVNSTPAVLQEAGPGNKVDVWIIGTDGNLWERYWTTAGFSSWANWGNPGVGLLGSPAVIQDLTPEASGQIDVWVRGSDNHLYERYWSMTANSLGPWIDWGGTGVASPPAVLQDTNGQIDVFVQGTDRHLWERFWTPAGFSDWINWGLPD